MSKKVMLQAEPESLDIDLQRTAIMVIDMQNGFLKEGSAADLLGWGISRLQEAIEPTRRVIGEARAKGIKVIYVFQSLAPDMCSTSEPISPYWHKELPRLYREHPEARDKLTVHGTWGQQITDELRPQEGDVMIEKPRFSAFSGTDGDAILRTHSIKYIAFTGVATNCCVEASIRDAFNLDYFPILVSDACAPGGPEFLQESTIENVKWAHGWVTTAEKLTEAMRQC